MNEAAESTPSETPAADAPAPTRRKRRRRSWKFKLVGLAVGLLFSLLVGEVGARVLGLGATTITRGSLHKYDPDVGWICTPGLDSNYEKPGSFKVRIRCNSQGIRELKEIPIEKPAGERRIVVLGDSVMWGWGLEDDETVSARLEALIPGTESINLGANGYSLVQSLVRLETQGLRYSPDVILYAFVSNDLEDNFDEKKGGRPVVVMQDGEATIANRPVRRQWKSPLKQWVRHHSRLFGLLEFTTERWKVHRNTQKAIAAAKVDVAERNEATAEAYRKKVEGRRAKGQVIVSTLDLYGTPTEVSDQTWGAQQALLAQVKAKADAAGAKLVVLYVTSRADVSQEGFTTALARYGLDPKDPALGLDIDRPRKRLGAICAELGVTYVDPTERMRTVEDEETLYLPNDGHWSAIGANIAAEQVTKAISE